MCLARVLGFCVGRSYWNCHQQVACSLSRSLVASHSFARSLLHSSRPYNCGGKANDATAVGIALPFQLDHVCLLFQLFKSPQLICHNIVADDRTGDFPFSFSRHLRPTTITLSSSWPNGALIHARTCTCLVFVKFLTMENKSWINNFNDFNF